MSREPLHEVAGRVGLAGAGRAVQQQPALEVLPGRLQLGAALGDVDGVALDAPQHLVGQHDVLAGGRGQDRELDRPVALHLEQLAAVDVEPRAQLGQLAVDLLRLRRRQAGDLHVHAGLVPLRPAQQDDVRPALVGHEQQGPPPAGCVRSGPDGRSTTSGADSPSGPFTSPWTMSCSAGRAVLLVEGQPVDGDLPARRRDPRVERHLQVDLLERRHLRDDDRRALPASPRCAATSATTSLLRSWRGATSCSQLSSSATLAPSSRGDGRWVDGDGVGAHDGSWREGGARQAGGSPAGKGVPARRRGSS